VSIDGEGIVTAPNPRSSMYNVWSRGQSKKNPWAKATNAKMAPFDQEVRQLFKSFSKKCKKMSF